MNTDLIVPEPQQLMQPQTMDHAIGLAGAILDKQIATARAFPRSIVRFKNEAIQLLQSDIETARSAEYSKPVGGGSVKGPSIRLCEIAAMCWGNLQISIEPPVVTDKSVTVQAIAFDLERNFQAPGIATASIIGKHGRYPQHLIETTISATASKARRNAIAAVIPRAYINDLLEAAKQVSEKNQPPLEERRQKALDYFARSHNVTPAQIFQYFQLAGIDDMTVEHLGELEAIRTAIKEGEPVEAWFGKPVSKADEAKAKLAERQGKANDANRT